ncbi:MAG: bifunctional 5,10-methylenetetrahydrofolate dehydrogenase/5,10-methenyltetrahydrofolate cyclohydrolase [Phycisphaerales bacterium]|nr:bifunctional 5,10-methylenetetrahydrofolate dehydrogenase/5,10-methenyltetrahydrofolate cyclohydrolase [Phycisphaerales bacterium]MCB9863612.1 bifunctional 5,10-methylenetetrahydrofolate dehydrogenase/5,10-methenyltetrahydrofolate cyclohydrolase [Phycisphaerales bacterium]
MSAKLIDGKALAARIREGVAARAAVLREKRRPPKLACLLIGDDAASISYAGSQQKHAEGVGIDYELRLLPGDCDMQAALGAVDALNADAGVSGIIIQMPVPKGLDGFALQQRIAAAKDVEGVGAANLGLLAMGRDALAPCTAAAAFACCQATGVEIKGKEAVVVGRSVIVGKPLAMLLLGAHATVTQCHTRTRDLVAHTRRAELLFVAAGVPQLIGREHVSEGAIVIDVGTHRVDAGDGKKKTVGDVRFDEVAGVASQITPVPGGVGPVTVAMLLENTVAAAERG